MAKSSNRAKIGEVGKREAARQKKETIASRARSGGAKGTSG